MTNTETLTEIKVLSQEEIDYLSGKILSVKELNKKFSYSNKIFACLDIFDEGISNAVYKSFFKENRINFLENIGIGSHGIVYKVKYNQEEKAVKILNPFFLRTLTPIRMANIRNRFYNEANTLKWLSQFTDDPRLEKIVKVYEYGERSGLAYFISDYIDGQSLKEKLTTASKKENIDYLTQATLGLAFTHKHDIVHLDIKPSNILVDKYGNAKLSDYGIARTGPVDADNSFEGNFAYGALEQEGGLNHCLVSPKTDIYAMGGILYEILSGEQFNIQKIKYIAGFETNPEQINPSDLENSIYCDIAEPFKQIIKDCTQDRIDKRPSAMEFYDRLIEGMKYLNN